MCGIFYGQAKDLYSVVENQKGRGLSSIGFIYPEQEKIKYKKIIGRLSDYKEEIENTFLEEEERNVRVIGHQRMPSYGAVNLENCHPFIGDNFTLIQNGSEGRFLKLIKDKVDCDTEALLIFLNKKAKNTAELIKELNELNNTYYTGALLIFNNKTNEVIAYFGGDKDSYISIKDDTIDYIASYKKNTKIGYKNKGYIIFDFFSGKIIENKIEKINPKYDYLYTYNCSNYDYKKPYDNYDVYAESLLIFNGQGLKEFKEYLKKGRKKSEKGIWFLDILSEFLMFNYGVSTLEEYGFYYKNILAVGGFRQYFNKFFS